jgi:hypothetical protein
MKEKVMFGMLSSMVGCGQSADEPPVEHCFWYGWDAGRSLVFNLVLERTSLSVVFFFAKFALIWLEDTLHREVFI